MFKEALQGVVDQIDGGMAGMLMDFEGIPLEMYARDEDFFDVEVVGAEASVLPMIPDPHFLIPRSLGGSHNNPQFSMSD